VTIQDVTKLLGPAIDDVVYIDSEIGVHLHQKYAKVLTSAIRRLLTSQLMLEKMGPHKRLGLHL
jgi:hypothetical protein